MSEVAVKESAVSDTLNAISDEYHSRWGVTKVRLSQNAGGNFDVWSAGVSTHLEVRPNDLLLMDEVDQRLDTLIDHLSQEMHRTVRAVTLDLMEEPHILMHSCM